MAGIFAPQKVALISGAASGIGLAVAQLCRKHSMRLALVDNNTELLERAKQSIGSSEKTETYNVDVSKIEQWASLKKSVLDTFGGVDFLMLNAGIGLKGGWEDSEYFHKIMDVNLFGQIHGINTFLPIVQQSKGPSAVVLVGSKQGITNPPGNPAYNASKAAINFLAQHLSYDLRDTDTSVHLLVPGWTFTGLSGGAPGSTKEKPAGAWAPSQVADFMKNKIDAGSFWALCPDNDVTEEMDKKRMLWTAGDAVYGRPPLSRWREESKDEAQKWMDEQKF